MLEETQQYDFIYFLFFIQKRHKADSVVNKKECQGTEKSCLSLMIKVSKWI